MTNFAELLSKKADDVKEPVPLPPGTYTLQIKDYETVESSQKGTPGIRFNFAIVDVGEDVDQDVIAENEIDVSKKGIRDTFWITDDALFRLKQFLGDKLGLAGDGRTFAEMLPETPGKTVKAYIVQEPSTKPGSTAVYNNVQEYGLDE